MDSSLLIVLFVAFVALQFFLRSRERRNQQVIRKYQAQRFQDTQDDEDEDELQSFPYEAQSHFLSPAELSFFQNLRRVVGNRAVVSTKVGLGDVFWVKLEDQSKFRAYRNKIDRKHVDFLLCDAVTMQPLLGIELDDKSHQREDRQARDAFVDQVFAAAKLPLLHIPAQRAYVVEQITAQLAPYLGVVPTASMAVPAPVKPIQASEPPSPAPPANTAPLCPKCGSEMILRTAKSGANAGNKFWGCSKFPTCRGMVAFTE